MYLYTQISIQDEQEFIIEIDFRFDQVFTFKSIFTYVRYLWGDILLVDNFKLHDIAARYKRGFYA